MADVSPRPLGRRLTSLLAALALVGAPALVLRALCVGRSCDDRQAASPTVPFCPLPADVRADITAGFRAGRSPDVMATTALVPVIEPADQDHAPWPAAASPDLRVPIAFLGRGVQRSSLPEGMGLDQIAPSLARALGYDRPHPEVRAGTAVPLNDPGAPALAPQAIPLIVEIAWKGVGAPEVGGSWPPGMGALIRRDGAGTLAGDAGSLPLDPAATLTTIGTGGLPFQHGITGSRVRTDQGGVRWAWSGGAPTSVISTLADALRHSFGAGTRVGMVATDRTDRGLIGDGWYLGARPGQLVRGVTDPVRSFARFLDEGYGTSDGAPDVLGVVLQHSVGTDDALTGTIVRNVLRRVPDALVVVAGTGSPAPRDPTPRPTSAPGVGAQVDDAMGGPVVAGTVAGGFFLAVRALNAANLTADAVVQQMRSLDARGGTPLFSEVFPAFSVAFSRYC